MSADFEDPFAGLRLDDPYQQLSAAIWRMGRGDHNSALGDTVRMTAVCLVAEYETVENGLAIRMNVTDGKGVLPHWRAKGLVQALKEFVDGEVTEWQGGNAAGPTLSEEDEG